MRVLALFLLLTVLAVPAGWAEPPVPVESPLTAKTAPAPGHAAEGGHQEPGMFDLNVGIFLSQTVNFFVLLYLLNRFLYKPVNDILEHRRALITRNIHDAEDARLVANQLRQKYEEHLASAEQEAYKIRQEAIVQAQASGKDIVEKAKTDAEKILQNARKEIMIEKQKAWVGLRQEVVRLTLLTSEKIIEKSLDDPTHHDLIEKTISRLEIAP